MLRYNDVSELPHNLLLSSTTPDEPCPVSPSLKLPCLPQWGAGLRVRLLASEPPEIQLAHSSWVSFPTKKPQATNNKTETHRQQENRPRKSLSRGLRAPAARVEAQGLGGAGAEVCSQGPTQILEGAQCWRHRDSDLAEHPGNWTETPKRLHLRSRTPQYLPSESSKTNQTDLWVKYLPEPQHSLKEDNKSHIQQHFHNVHYTKITKYTKRQDQIFPKLNSITVQCKYTTYPD